MPKKDTILSSLIPISEWWMFTERHCDGLRQSWSDWSLDNCDIEKVIVMFKRTPNNKEEAYLEVYGKQSQLAEPVLKHAEKYFNVEDKGKCTDHCPFEDAVRTGNSFLLSIK